MFATAVVCGKSLASVRDGGEARPGEGTCTAHGTKAGQEQRTVAGLTTHIGPG